MSVAAYVGEQTWRQVAVIRDGKNVPLGWSTILLTADADDYTVTVNGKVYQRGSAKHDYDKAPPQSDVMVTEGPWAGKTSLQIFKYEGDVLIACNAAPGAARPTEFTSQPGSGHTLSVWLRTEAASPPAGPLTSRSWTMIVVLCLLGGVIGGVSQGLETSLGRWAGILGGWAAGILFITAIFRLLKNPWPTALAYGIAVSLASSAFDALKTTLTPTLGALGAYFVSASTIIVAAILVWAVLTRLLKLRL